MARVMNYHIIIEIYKLMKVTKIAATVKNAKKGAETRAAESSTCIFHPKNT